MARDRFVNPANGQAFDWPVNHESEDEQAKTRTLAARATTGLNRRVWTQGEDQPMTLRWMGKILSRNHLRTMWDWYNLSGSQTVYLYDFDGQGYEVFITAFRPKRERKLSYYGKDPTVPHHYWSYTIEFVVVSFIQGDLAGRVAA